MFLWILLILNILFWFIAYLDAYTGLKKVRKLESIKSQTHEDLVSVIIAARNEEDDIEQSLRSHFQQTHPHIEWIVVNDRSTDQTKSILETLKTEHDTLEIIHITDLPVGWLGKNYALYQGYLKSNGRYLLFTDADIILKPEVIKLALTYLKEEAIDHVTLTPNLNAKGFWLQAFVAFFLFGFSYFKRPWKGNDDRSKIGIGIGAFNLLSREAYEKIGTHQNIAMRPDDDLQLGMKIKEHKLRQQIATAISLINVYWYSNLKEALIGLEKNTFAGLHYRMYMVIIAVVGIALSHIFPFIMLFLANGWLQWISIIVVGLIFLLYHLIISRMTGFTTIHFIVFPITALLFIYSICRAIFLTFKRGGIAWRGTIYSLKELRKK
ncbi:glycosyltransferase [Bacillus sp. Marseille-P3661]|uniref:glycosyltransferase n=1 Tax=Bacillus sp. Marseille-P3661 TaxID=1936234 RepID=UPI000C826A31|nr:glycosyltransferase family 2 protein [Bacillus sp. Marseille-P3661]